MRCSSAHGSRNGNSCSTNWRRSPCARTRRTSELVRPLQDADAKPLKTDTAENRIVIASIIKRCIDSGAKDLAERQRDRLRLMYPKRRMLQRMLDAVMAGDFNQYDPQWQHEE